MLTGSSFHPVSTLTNKASYRGDVAEYGFNEDYAIASDSRAFYPGDDGNFVPEEQSRKITKTASLNTEVDRGDFQNAEDKLKVIVDDENGLILNENVNKFGRDNKYMSGSYSIQVPTSNYDIMIIKLKELGEITYFSENANDITGQYLSTEERLEAERSRLQNYEAILSEAESAEEKLNIADRIYNLERTIKHLEESLTRQDLRIEYTNIHVSITEEQSEYTDIAITKFSDLIRSLVNAVNSVLHLVFWAIPYAIVIWVIRIIYVKTHKPVSKKR